MSEKGKDAKSTKLGSVIVFLGASFFGTYPVLAKLAYLGGVNNVTLLFVRFSGAALIIWLYLWLSRRWGRSLVGSGYKKIEPWTGLKLFLLGAVIYGAMSGLNLIGITRVSASLSCLLLCTYPVFVTIITVLTGREKMDAVKGIALLTAFVGVYLLLNVVVDTLDPLGVICAIGSSMVFTAYVVIGDQLMTGLNPIETNAYVMTGSAVTYTISGLLSKQISFNFVPASWWYILTIIIFATVLALVMFWAGILILGPAKGSIIGMVEPLATVVIARFVFTELLTPMQLLGAALILGGIFILQYPWPSRKSVAAS